MPLIRYGAIATCIQLGCACSGPAEYEATPAVKVDQGVELVMHKKARASLRCVHAGKDTPDAAVANVLSSTSQVEWTRACVPGSVKLPALEICESVSESVFRLLRRS
jgi:hypothetical protein